MPEGLLQAVLILGEVRAAAEAPRWSMRGRPCSTSKSETLIEPLVARRIDAEADEAVAARSR